MLQVHQINLQPAVGGGEVYTRWFTRALTDAGARVTLYVDALNRSWEGLASPVVDIAWITDWRQIVERLPDRGAVIITQSRLPDSLAEIGAQNHLLTGFAHMPILGRSAAEFARYATVFTVSKYCVDLLLKAGISQVYPVPLYGTGALDRNDIQARRVDSTIRPESPYHWDKRKGRDRLFALLEPSVRSFVRRDPFVKRPGLTLGIVSLLSPIKQFPALFSLLAPHIARYPAVNLEIFGDGGYAQVRDLKQSLAPLAQQFRFWGYQKDVEAIYPQIDYLMTGLPEKEALGLNALESQMLGTPVLAPRAPPFTETILHEQSGFLYRDPREDGGREFGGLLASLVAGRARPDPRAATEHLAKFSYDAMVNRAAAVVEHLGLQVALTRRP